MKSVAKQSKSNDDNANADLASGSNPKQTCPQTLSKTFSSPTELSGLTSSIATAATTTNINTPIVTRPKLLPLNKTVPPPSSTNFRLSQLSDSGAESGDADDQSRLIRTPSLRSHKFIIIPSTAAAGANAASATPTTGGPKFRQTNSATSLVALAAMRASPVRSTSSRPLSTASMASTTSALAASLASAAVSDCPTGAPPIPDMPLMRTTATAAIKSNMPVSAGSGALPGVIFTIEDYESDHASGNLDSHSSATTTTTKTTTAKAKASTHRQQQKRPQLQQQPPPPPPATITSINNGTTSASIATSGMISTSAQTTATGNVAGTSALGVGLRPRNERQNSSMRSVVSAYMPSVEELDAQFLQPHNAYLQPGSTRHSGEAGVGAGKEWSVSASFLHRDPLANQIYSDEMSVRSLASIGIGSTDGRKLVIRRVPHTPDELFNFIQPPPPVSSTPAGVDDDDDDSFMDMSDETAYLKPRRQHWGNKMQFVLACIGYSVGLGNVWRFPYMCYKSGGGVFLVPYCIILVICSIPLLFMELSVGQYTGRGPIGALGQLCPLFKGAGLASVVVSFLMSTYYSVIIAYSIYYFFTAFKPMMPWIDCSNRWNTVDCWVPQRMGVNVTAPPTSRTPSEEFFENKVLQISRGIEFPGDMRWELFACLICAWLMVYFATWKSIKSSAKVRYFTATFPFVLIIILLGRAVTLDGADDGLRYFFRPNWDELKNANVWINAASQNFNSLGITFGSMISFASYNKYNNNIVRDTISVSVVNVLTSLLVGVFAFATLGNLALEQNTNVRDVISDGPGIIFVVYPQAMAKMPYAQLWAVMFFFMLLCLGLNSQFAIVEVVVTSIQDGFPNWIKRNLGYHEIVVLFVCVISFLFGLPNLIQGGIYFFQLMDHYAASVSIMFLAFCQMVAIAWFYGSGRLSKNVKQMTGKAPTMYLKSCWVLLGPCLLFAIWILSLVNYQEPTYHNGRYKYPDWAYGIGWMFASFSLICIPAMAVISLVRSTGDTFWERVSNALHPHIYECPICGEHHCEHDYPEQEQYMLAQEMASPMYKANEEMKLPVVTSSFGVNPTAQQRGHYTPVHSPSTPSSPTAQKRQLHADVAYEKSNQHPYQQYQQQILNEQRAAAATALHNAAAISSAATR